MLAKPEGYTVEFGMDTAKSQTLRFLGLIERWVRGDGAGMIRVDECYELVGVYLNTMLKGAEWEALDDDERREMLDCWYDVMDV